MTNNVNGETVTGDNDDDLATMVRALVAYGDTVGMTGIDLVMNAHDDTPTAIRTREIVAAIKGAPMTDSDVDDITEFIDGSNDDWNE